MFVWQQVKGCKQCVSHGQVNLHMFCICVCAYCMCVCTWVHMCVELHKCMYVKTSSFVTLFLLFWDMLSQWTQSLWIRANWLANHSSLVSLSPPVISQVCTNIPCFLTGVLKMKFRSSYLYSPQLNNWTTSSVLACFEKLENP